MIELKEHQRTEAILNCSAYFLSALHQGIIMKLCSANDLTLANSRTEQVHNIILVVFFGYRSELNKTCRGIQCHIVYIGGSCSSNYWLVR